MRALIAGAGGFIGGHLTKKLLDQGFDVTAVDKKSLLNWSQVFDQANNLSLDLSEPKNCYQAVEGSDWVFNLAADMGGMGFIEKNRALCMISVLINTNLLVAAKNAGVKKYFFASSACVYASQFQNFNISKSVSLREQNAYPADPEDGYGWEKLFSERMCRHFYEDFNFEVRVARYHNIYGPYGTFYGGREKAPSAAIRKMLEFKSKKSDNVEIWGNGKQLRSFTFVDDCIDGTLLLMNSNYTEPINIGSSETISIQELYDYAATSCGVSNPPYTFNLTAPIGVLGRSSNNDLCLKILDWEPKIKFKDGIAKTANWITSQTKKVE